MGWSTRQNRFGQRSFKKLEENYGVDTSDDAIRKAVEEHNKICRIITEIGEYRKEENPRITGYEIPYSETWSPMSVRKYLILDRLQETLEEIRNREPDEKKNYRARVVIAGSEIDDPDFTKLVGGGRCPCGSRPFLLWLLSGKTGDTHWRRGGRTEGSMPQIYGGQPVCPLYEPREDPGKT